MSDSVLSEIDGAVGLVTLNRPERHNAFDDALIVELTQILRRLDGDPQVRIVVLGASGPSFSAGADLNWMRRMAGYSEEENFRDAMALAELMSTLNTLSKPTIARINGPAYGGGVGLVACCDIAIATREAVFSLSEVRLGLIPAVISPYVIARIGEGMARRYFLTAERFDAPEAFRIGLIHDLVPGEPELDEAVGEMIDTLLQCGPEAQRESKRLIAAVAGRPVDEAVIRDTAQRIARVRASSEGREGIGAFLAKRKPSWVKREG